MSEITLTQALQQASAQLNTQDARQEAELLLCHVLGCSLVKLVTDANEPLSDNEAVTFFQLIDARNSGQPVAYLMGYRGFWDMDLAVTDATLIPRPDTELLVTLALSKMPINAVCADLGTGSGAIALAAAKQRSDSFWLASDYSLPALKVARQNAETYAVKNVQFSQGAWATMIAANRLDLLVSNPPYIEDDDPHLETGDLRFEPRSALASGSDGLDDIRHIVHQAPDVLKSGGWLLIEHGWNQSEAVQNLFKAAGFIEVSGHQDFGGQDRVVMGQLPSGKIPV
ncbi:peptide chain release factor N(5)-glutamine methyltransferase [Methylophaga sp. OBS3]|uniref:peptide chain release factor N(5)-glutamine methyltransferase n=1 Tax=Methylophaga sp. OBS3 TaxID=2991934 RepID=UPI00224EDF7B|nr:peptide chain release factor N(5)-glutamine methyltransferase [Methylophaga sp. OBS3]MCX4190735.1 peptide chain release factor N(5)-glutamine methyltransferase [Methylophaga sp. OBS3]